MKNPLPKFEIITKDNQPMFSTEAFSVEPLSQKRAREDFQFFSACQFMSLRERTISVAEWKLRQSAVYNWWVKAFGRISLTDILEGEPHMKEPPSDFDIEGS